MKICEVLGELTLMAALAQTPTTDQTVALVMGPSDNDVHIMKIYEALDLIHRLRHDPIRQYRVQVALDLAMGTMPSLADHAPLQTREEFRRELACWWCPAPKEKP